MSPGDTPRPRRACERARAEPRDVHQELPVACPTCPRPGVGEDHLGNEEAYTKAENGPDNASEDHHRMEEGKSLDAATCRKQLRLQRVTEKDQCSYHSRSRVLGAAHLRVRYRRLLSSYCADVSRSAQTLGEQWPGVRGLVTWLA